MSQQSANILFVFQDFSHFIKVTAVDEISGTEVCISCPKSLSKPDMQKAALQKLAYVMNKNNQHDNCSK
ncbi:MAG: hypothetical protein Q8K36_06320 [Alphaproteobacteria bacterium]|nr:hypothetical protein [Alphaproteobacteria bacterium]